MNRRTFSIASAVIIAVVLAGGYLATTRGQPTSILVEPNVPVLFQIDATNQFSQPLATNQTTTTLTVKIVAEFDGTLMPRVGNTSLLAKSFSVTKNADTEQTVTIPKVNIPVEGMQEVYVVFEYTDASGNRRLQTSNNFQVYRDTSPPELLGVDLIGIPGTDPILQARFRHADLAKASLAGKFSLQTINADGSVTALTGRTLVPELLEDGRTVQIHGLGHLETGNYRLKVLGTIADLVGNTPANNKDQFASFSSYPQPVAGEHVPFPQFTPPKQVKAPKEGFNPADFVQTRVARLYYYRDGHRVAQIINRNIRSLNQAAVTQSERRAEDSRDKAFEAAEERRSAERAAIRAAQATRRAEQELAAAQAAFSEAGSLAQELKGNTALQAKLNGTMNQVELDRLNELKTRELILRENLAKFGGPDAVSDLQGSVTALQKNVANLREAELNAQDRVAEAEGKEERAARRQFNDEVAAAEEDPDTYVPGDIDSVDPVTQCSLSVIGEGVIQIRGPIKGINKIRTMINQIDSPLGQIKIGVETIQVNGEKGGRMEKVVGRIEGHLDLARFLTNQSLQLIRRAVQSEAGRIANQCGADDHGHNQIDRDRKYLYSFFGRDFIDELYAMDSEFLHTENKLLSLHSMDTISLNRALFILALARNDVRQNILTQFMELVRTELPEAEWDYRRSSELYPHRTHKWLPFSDRTKIEEHTAQRVFRNATQRYHFRNFLGFFNDNVQNPNSINPAQREFIRMAQIFKSQMIAEVELKQRVIERGLIEDPANSDEERAELLRPVHTEALEFERDAFQQLVATAQSSAQATEFVGSLASSLNELEAMLVQIKKASDETMKIWKETNRLQEVASILDAEFDKKPVDSLQQRNYVDRLDRVIQPLMKANLALESQEWATPAQAKTIAGYLDLWANEYREQYPAMTGTEPLGGRVALLTATVQELSKVRLVAQEQLPKWQRLHFLLSKYQQLVEDPRSDWPAVIRAYEESEAAWRTVRETQLAPEIIVELQKSYQAASTFQSAEARIKLANQIARRTRLSLNHRKLLNHLIDEHEDKYIELVEGTRSHIAAVDNYLKRLAIALEDDFKVQFYDPARVNIRGAAREYDVSLGQVERTTILTNNRAFAKVTPQATMEFDLPKRQIAVVEAFQGAKALTQDYGSMLNDPTFLSAFQMMGGGLPATKTQNLYPSLPSSNDQQKMGIGSGGPDPVSGSALQNLVPEPAIYKFETGTGFEIRPVIQPDGDSVVYDFHYMYTTNVREPVRADEKHLGRIKRHFIHTQVQTSSFELREISRYVVALKASRTGNGVPLLEDIPGLGALFRPAPSAESSLQQNIVLGKTTVYPTLFDLMGLRWAPHIVDLNHAGLLDGEHVVRGRRDTVADYVFDRATAQVDDILDVEKKSPEHYRTDLYRRQRLPSPYHPGGHTQPNVAEDPTGREYERIDRRPPEMRVPPYDRYRHRPLTPERFELTPAEVHGAEELKQPPALNPASPPADAQGRTGSAQPAFGSVQPTAYHAPVRFQPTNPRRIAPRDVPAGSSHPSLRRLPPAHR